MSVQASGTAPANGPVVVTGMQQTMPDMDPQTGLVDCAWVNPFALTTATPGELLDIIEQLRAGHEPEAGFDEPPVEADRRALGYRARPRTYDGRGAAVVAIEVLCSGHAGNGRTPAVPCPGRDVECLLACEHGGKLPSCNRGDGRIGIGRGE